MHPLFQTSTIAGALFYGTVVIVLVMELRQSTKSRDDATPHDRGSQLAVRGSILAGAIAGIVATHDVPGADIHHRWLLFGIGLVVLWAGAALRWWAFRTLGQYFTFTVMTSSDQRVVSAGPYRIVRHPGYSGAVLILTGIGLTYGNWLSLAAMILLPLVGLVYRIKVEEAALLGTLGDAYRSYAHSRKRLVPFVW